MNFDQYTVNKKTLAILPARTVDYQAIVLEDQQTYQVRKTPLEIIKNACIEIGFSTLKGKQETVHFSLSVTGTGVPIVHIPEITLKDPSFWKEIRKRLTDKQWKWIEYFIIADLTIKEIMELETFRLKQ